MKTQFQTLMIMSAFIAGFININNVQADDAYQASSLYYDNSAYVHAIHNAPNPVKDTKVEFAKIAYADKAYGQAIYSYPSNISFQEIDFNMEYVDTAYGQAIYSYPNNNPVRHHLELSAETHSPVEKFIVPAVLTKMNALTPTINP